VEGYGAAINAMQVLDNPPGFYFKFPKPQEGGGSLWDFAASAAIFNECGAVRLRFLRTATGIEPCGFNLYESPGRAVRLREYIGR